VTPYKLALGAVTHFDTILVTARDDDGRRGVGEATVLTGYTHETIDGAWRLAADLAPKLPGLTAEAAEAVVAPHDAASPFLATAFRTAIEMLAGHPLLRLSAPARVPLLAVVNEMDEAAMEAEVAAHLAGGYGTLKVKVGFDVDRDLKRVRFIQDLAGRAALRLDGNQGYGREEALRFVQALDPTGIELLEQPCAADDWEAAAAVARASPVPTMLDESIYGMDDVARAADAGAAYVKLKLMKMGGLDRLAAGLERIRALALRPVLGNGVASDVGCWMEACVARTHIDNAGEMNGFLKPRWSLLRRPLAVRDGALVLDPTPPVLDADAVARATVETATVTAP
jgi:L-alanine-DL-glutamate epimerase-like enolase superfamily enzyme